MRDLDFVRGRLDVHSTMVEVDGYMEESSPKDCEERSVAVPEFILEQLSIHVEDKTPADHVFVSSKSGSVLRSRTFRRGWFSDAAEQIGFLGLIVSGIGIHPAYIAERQAGSRSSPTRTEPRSGREHGRLTVALVARA